MHDIFIVDLGSHDHNIQSIIARYPHAQVTRFYGDVLSTLTRCVRKANTKHFWFIISCADIENFDLDWDPTPWENNQIHAWPTTNQKYGDVLLIPKQQFLQQQPEKLHWFEHVNYHTEVIARVPWPVMVYHDKDFTTCVKQTDFVSEYQYFSAESFVSTSTHAEPALWGEETLQLISYSADNATCLVPRVAQNHLHTQAYDYPTLVKYPCLPSQAQDIVFISYDEPQADENYAILQQRFPQAKRVHGVEGMEHALRRAAEISRTPWFYATFAKTRLHEDWDFGFVPDRWQEPKHYIFNAINNSNDLCYGHMGIILYHKNLVLAAPDWDGIAGMDYTMSFATESIPIVSVYGEFATDPYRAWRTAFRETAKLTQWYLDNNCIETKYRIHVWCNHATGEHAEWVMRGAKDGVKYFEDNLSDTRALKRMFRWDWLNEHFLKLYAHDL